MKKIKTTGQGSSGNDPYALITEFFEWYSLDGSKQELALLTAPVEDGGDEEATPHRDLLFFREKLNSLLDAAWMICQSFSKYPEEGIS